MAFAHGHRAAGIVWQRQCNANTLRAFDYMGVGHDVAGGIDDHPGADDLLADDESCLGTVLFVRGAVTGNQDLNHSGRNLSGETFESIVELEECGGCGGGFVGPGLRFFLGGFVFGGARSGSWRGGLLRRRLLR